MAQGSGGLEDLEDRLSMEHLAARLRALHGTYGALARVWARARAARQQGDTAALRACARLLDMIAGLHRFDRPDPTA